MIIEISYNCLFEPKTSEGSNKFKLMFHQKTLNKKGHLQNNFLFKLKY